MDDFDVEALLDAPFIKQNEEKKSASPEQDIKKKNKKKKRSRSRERERSYKESKDSNHIKNEKKSNRRDRSRSQEHRDSTRVRDRRNNDYNSRDRRPLNRSPDRRRNYNPRTSYRGSFGGNRDYQNRRYGRDRRSRSKSRDKKNSSSKSKNRSPSPRKESKGNGSSDEFGKPARLHKNPDLTPEERDMRTVFCMQLSQKVRARDLEEFFSPVGKVQDVRIIMDNKTRRSKGIAYVEFQDTFSVSLAMGYTSKKLLGVPIIVQLTQAEKNRAAASAMNSQRGNVGPMRLYVGSLHFNITEEMLKGIFEPFGKIDKIELLKDTETGRSKGYGFVTFHDSESAKKALDQLNGFELAGRPMKVGTVTDRTDLVQGPSFLDTEEMDRAGIDLGATGRLQLMAKLAEGTGFELPQAAVKALQLTSQATTSPITSNNPSTSVATQCFLLSNMFDPTKETNSNWDEEIRNDVIDECRNHGGALHVYVDKNSPDGNVYVKCPSLAAAAASVTALHGRYFAGRVIVAAYVPLINYHMLFPDSANITSVL
ncbi:RNA-binding protein 39 [Trichonephila inaurata madagascariensis]|uniref:RNA-binding protein 39 n=1 Tax=Trichonephila inaurata madagascariensis TaxID=2747483 RepID=A0A8X6ICF7_9ARAC|nr:RNA-binding protein 39 [Trichonephila inaurata madagascariensis]